MFKNVEQFHGHFIQYAVFKVVVGKAAFYFYIGNTLYPKTNTRQNNPILPVLGFVPPLNHEAVGIIHDCICSVDCVCIDYSPQNIMVLGSPQFFNEIIL